MQIFAKLFGIWQGFIWTICLIRVGFQWALHLASPMDKWAHEISCILSASWNFFALNQGFDLKWLHLTQYDSTLISQPDLFWVAHVLMKSTLFKGIKCLFLAYKCLFFLSFESYKHGMPLGSSTLNVFQVSTLRTRFKALVSRCFHVILQAFLETCVASAPNCELGTIACTWYAYVHPHGTCT